jgi:hypothetical protein
VKNGVVEEKSLKSVEKYELLASLSRNQNQAPCRQAISRCNLFPGPPYALVVVMRWIGGNPGFS